MKNLNFVYSTACRSCMESMPLKSTTIIEVDKLENWLVKPEYDVMVYLENYRKQKGETCMNCGGCNIEVYNIESFGLPYYEFRRLVMLLQTGNMEDLFMLNITKNSGSIAVNKGGNDYASPKFIKECILKMIEKVNSLSEDYFKDYHKGNFFMCLTYNNNGRGKFTSIEKFRLHGMTRSEILVELNKTLKTV